MALFLIRCVLTIILYLPLANLYALEFNFRKLPGGYESGITISLGAYQTYANSFIYLRHKGSTPILRPDESMIYRYLISRLLKPRYLLFQVTTYPLALISSHLETFHPYKFDRFELMGWNMLRSVGSGPEEPYALSLLLGNLAFFGSREKIVGEKSRIKQLGSAMAGFLISTGHWHIYDNIRIDDRWWQTELILTGNLKEPNIRKILWNFRIGAKIHGNKFVPDVVLLAFQRNHTEWHYRGISLLRSSVIRYEAHFPIGPESGRSPFAIRQLFTYGKKIPFKLSGRFIALRLGGGVLWEWVRRYDHEKRIFRPEETSHLLWMIQPSVEF